MLRIVFLISRDIKLFVKKLGMDSVSAYSAQTAFFIIISFFPFLMLFLTLLKYTPFSLDEISKQSLVFISPSVSSFIETVFKEIYDKSSGTIISITTITALWSASRGLLAIIKGLNSVYGINEKRGYFKLRFATIIYIIVLMLVLILMLAFFAFGNSIVNWIITAAPYMEDFMQGVMNLRWVIGIVFLILFFLFIYTIVPTHKSTFLHELPGAIISSIGWITFSALYSFYIENIANYSYFYGSLTAIVLLMLWLYFCMYILFLGAEINNVLQDKNYFNYVKSNFKRFVNKKKKEKTM